MSDLRAEVSQIKKIIKKPQYSHVQHLNSAGGQQDNIIQQVTTPLPVPLPLQGQWPTPGYSWQGSHIRYNQMVTSSPHSPHQPPNVEGAFL